MNLNLCQESCRFCLEVTTDGIHISETKYFCIDRRLVASVDVLESLDLNIREDRLNPNLPQKICNECRKIIVAFFSLRKSFRDNEAILLGETKLKPENDPANSKSLIPIVEEFIKDHRLDNIKVSKYTDKLVIKSLSNESNNDEQNHPKLQVFMYDRLSSQILCDKCCERFDSKIDFYQHQQQDHDQHHQHFSPDFEDLSNNTTETNPGFREYDSDDGTKEEYLFEEESGSQEDAEQQPPALQIKSESGTLFFNCSYCEKGFLTRSGRDTHQQLKHRVPDDFDASAYEDDYVEKKTESGELFGYWLCKTCKQISRKKDHHLIHVKRHAIKLEDIKQEQEQETCFVIMKSQHLAPDDPNEKEVIEQQIIELETTPKHGPQTCAASIENATQILNIDKKRVRKIEISSHVDPNGGKVFSCPACNSHFRTNKDAYVHVQKFTMSGLCTSAVCSECSVVFPSLKAFRRHQEFHSLKEISESFNYSELICYTCFVIFSKPDDLENHLTQHVSDSKYCYENKSATLPDGCEALFDKINLEWNKTDYRCGYCAMVGEKDSITFHLTLFHTNLICPFDKQDFGRHILYFMDHMKIKHPEHFTRELSFSCSHCGQYFPSKKDMLIHCRSCQAKKFDCSHCDRKFVHERQLREHLGKVNGIKSHKCPECSRFFVNRADLNVHLRVHSNVKPYACTFPECDKIFRTNSHRSSHMDTHNASENYQCSICPLKFKTRGARRIHQKKHTGSLLECKICQKEFSQKSHLVRHVNFVHRIACNSFNVDELTKSSNRNRKSPQAVSDDKNQQI